MISAVGFRGCIFVRDGIQTSVPLKPDLEHVAAPVIVRLVRAYPSLLKIEDFWPNEAEAIA
jgi:hypothetical protein